jgi:hypothetical protein
MSLGFIKRSTASQNKGQQDYRAKYLGTAVCRVNSKKTGSAQNQILFGKPHPHSK